MSVPSVLFVCGRNAIRSPMAAALWRRQFGDAAQARSCGVIPAAFADGYMLAVMAELGCDLEDISPMALSGVIDPPAALVVSLSSAADRLARQYAADKSAEFQAWPIPDPSETGGSREQRLAAYRQTRDAIKARIADWDLPPKSA
ncbi:low molecular weight phosphatase family protein [uncultured Maricaulis sp.]|uniref:arsenate-mycothiol transferase ArsC n=1 Tax=uncultured Maricaulis sp. TaxID=174710 RepID=UPI0030DB8919|tara:strand:- start:87 stop:521 length:435 start_codon:yes stop_codon:yes gene_type:complete